MNKNNYLQRPISREARLLAYSAAVGAVLSVTPSAAEANIVYYEGPWTASGRDHHLISFNLAGEVLTTGARVPNEQFHFSNSFREDWKGVDMYDMLLLHAPAPNAAVFIATWENVFKDRFAYVRPLGAGAQIGQNINMWGRNSLWLLGTAHNQDHDWAYDYWQNGKRAYIGLQFDGPGDAIYYGWADITTLSKQGVTLWGYAYEDSGGPILTGATPPPPVIPVPSTLLLLASGAAGLAALRRRNQQSGKTFKDNGLKGLRRKFKK